VESSETCYKLVSAMRPFCGKLFDIDAF